MKTIRLPEMVKKVSKMVKNQSIHSSINNNNVTISLDAWDFHFIRLESLGYYIFDSITINNSELSEKNESLKKTIMREIICKYGVTISF